MSPSNIDPAQKAAEEKARAIMTPPPQSTEPSPEAAEIPAVTLGSARGAAARPAQPELKSKVATPPAIPRGKNLRIIRVKTAEGVIAFINADDYDPEMFGHQALTPEDEKWGKLAVDARARADYEAERVAAIKRVVRGG